MRWLALLCGALLAPMSLMAQAGQAAVVVQIAGSSLYLNIGSDAGLATGDTVSVRRSAGTAVVGTLRVVAATPQRSLTEFAGPAFPLTRGDSLFVEVKRGAAAALVAAAVPPAAGFTAEVPQQAARRVDGSIGLEMWGSHNETIGVGSDPARLTRDIAMPMLRLNTMVTGPRSTFRLNLRAQQRTGPSTVWDRQTRVRINEARYDLRTSVAEVTFGRFFSDFDHQSAFWDGAAVRFGRRSRFSGGVAAGFEPLRGNEEVSFDTPKLAGFLSTEHRGTSSSVSADLAVTQTLPKDSNLRRTGADFVMRLRVGGISITQDIEAAPPSPGASWELSRFIFRGSVPVGRSGSIYAIAVSDRFTPLDTAFLFVFTRRERITSGYSVSLRSGAFVDVNASVNQPGDSLQGYSAGTTLSVPRVLGGTVSLHTSWFDDGKGTGLFASPAYEYLLGSTRLRVGYQYYGISGSSFDVRTHALDFRASRPLGDRISGIVAINERIGHNIRSTTIFTSFEVRF